MTEDDLHTQIHASIESRLQGVEKFASEIKSSLSKLQGHIYGGAALCGVLIGVIEWGLKK